ncbi:response regulator [Marinagarivorans cellulosilyticus]|uniref:histidine kinase n=1 Tax=Marinagarivorans cellulosilyticus TaxID=2721545 RepID=A0AAN2BKW0_9GAMM|nr:response regulator [Marinagarivorans cellulosilyticus]BCD98493.1 two-component system, NarL family, sensor histidine kinase BarA [Marinagarivorans cellulosilyticus]
MLTSPIKWDANGKPVLTLIVTPIFITCVLCIATFVLLHNSHRENLNRASYHFLAKYFAQQIASPADNKSMEQWFQTHANIALHTSLYEQFTLLNNSLQPLAHVGLPSQHRSFNWINTNKDSQLQHDAHTHLAFQSKSLNGKKFWVVATMNDTPASLLFFQTLLWGILCTGIAGITIAWLAMRCHRQLITPISRLTQELQQAAAENFDAVLTIPQNHLYANLIHAVQQLLDMNKDLKDSTQHYIDQATQELRESLETVEIQNIELDIARKNALQASADKSELLATTSHEIRTPLNGILGFTNLLIKTQLSDQQKDYLATIEQSAQGLLTVINDVIDFSRLESGTMTFEYKPVKIKDTVAEILQVYAPSANESQLRLIQLIDPAIPPTLLGDPLRLKQVLNNLIHCLVGIESSGDLIVECTIQHKADSKMGIQFSLKNPSARLNIKQQTQLQQALASQGSLPVGDATGLGLTIAKALAERMQGNITVDLSGEGITFFFTIELGQTETQLDPTITLDTANIRAVVCDNNPFSRQEVVIALKTWNITPAIENNPDKLIAAISAARANLVILDFATDGRRFNKSRLEKHLEALFSIPQLHVVIIAPSNIRRQIESGAQWHDAHFITRPIMGDAFSQLLRRISGSPDDTEIPIARQHLKILVADDNPANTKLVCAFLQQKNHSIKAVANGKQALNAFLEDKPDIIFMDVQMPEMDGLQATTAIRKHEAQHKSQRVPIVALTANALPEQRAKILMSGMDDYLTKPVSDHDLKHALYRWIETRTASVHNHKPELAHAPNTSTEVPAATPNNAPKSDKDPVFSVQKSLDYTKGNAALALDMYKMLIQEFEQFKTAIEQGLATQSLEELSGPIHKLRGGLSYSGFILLQQQCEISDNLIAQSSELSMQVRSEVQQLLLKLEQAQLFTAEIDESALFDV